MNFPWIIEHMGGYLSAFDVERMSEELSAAIAEVGRTEVVSKIRDANGNCPRIVKLYDGKYQFQRHTRSVCIDWEDTVSYINYGTRLIDRGFFNTGLMKHGVNVYVSHDATYNGYTLSALIEYGEECEECGTIFISEEEETLCRTCRTAYEPLPYSTRAEELLEVEQTKELLFGVELEYEGVSARDVKQTIPTHAIAKRDGSIHDGVEVVTRPASLETHKKALQTFFNQVKTQAAPNTGMHVHVDRSKLSEFQIGFMMEFLNKAELVPHIEQIAGRAYGSNTYCRAKNETTMTDGLSFDEGSFKLVRSKTDKYSPLNTAKTNTVEVRIFSSPESMLECAARLDFVNALVKYSSPYSINVKRLKDKFNWDVFLEYVRCNAKQFPHFSALYL